ncbi:MAG: baseplate J/gp47 family protein [Pseudomonadota bacterium]
MSDGVTLAAIEALPPPEIIEPLDHATIYEEMRSEVQPLFDAAGMDYTVGSLETDPAQIILQALATRELNLRARINDGARANTMAFARGSDLDHKASDYDVLRMEGESDERLRLRTALAIAGRSAAGPEERYEAIAMSASIRVDEVKAYRVDGGPQLEIAVLATDNGGVPDQLLLDAVAAMVTDPNVLGINDTIRVVSAVKTFVDVTVDAWLLPGADATRLDALRDQLIAAWETEGGIGRDLAPSWINARLFVDGVARLTITGPVAPVVAAANEAISIQSVSITYRGVER